MALRVKISAHFYQKVREIVKKVLKNVKKPTTNTYGTSKHELTQIIYQSIYHAPNLRFCHVEPIRLRSG